MLAKSRFYEEARQFARLVTSEGKQGPQLQNVVVTGGGPGVMEAANRGARDVGGVSIGLNITLPEEQRPNAYITPGLCFQFHYFAIRKMHFLLRAKALVVFPGGFGTLDELFDALTLRQTGRMQDIPIISLRPRVLGSVGRLPILGGRRSDSRRPPRPDRLRRDSYGGLGVDQTVPRRRRVMERSRRRLNSWGSAAIGSESPAPRRRP